MGTHRVKQPRRGDHLFVSRGLYTHHGIYIGDQRVVHYSGELLQKRNAAVREDSLASFAHGGDVQVIKYARRLSRESACERALSRVGERDYQLLHNNCEHFARWCVTGEQSSEQTKDVASSGGAALATGAGTGAAIGFVSSAGAVAGLSGAGTMSGLATAGSVVGGGAVAGIGVLAAAPAALSVLAMRRVLADDNALSDEERGARRVGRGATVAGAALGAAGSIASISAAGSVAGVSGAGITSGLFAIGSGVGGGMVAGAAVTIAAPAVAAAAVGYGVYRLVRWLRRR